ncbi:ACT domain-containing protein [Streptomyces sp. TRM 70361]|uniref:ACT domain-containing protein n=1 Tax=Streptomyces sp. TRM 70361 TaxID=3116553 RepID=UPI002E7B8CEF|nr:ACT domain-containing protein [Streptomyces sp. TRM 70361]MEE1941307.1 ACT domain-containing protein [Streptomyces sp. TRM 70361]
MAGERDLRRLLAGLRPELDPDEYVFTTVPGDRIPPGLAPVVTVAEPEGLTLVLRRTEAERAGLPHDYTAGRIVLRVHSALDAVGLTAAVAAELAAAGLSCNVVAGFHHDHLFVPHERAREALDLLRALAARSGDPS